MKEQPHMRTAKAKSPPKPPRGSAESLKQKTAELKSATALLNAAKTVERELGRLPPSAQASAAFGSALMTSVVESARAKPTTLNEANALLTAALARISHRGRRSIMTRR
jgi:hypothetical protein